MSRDDTTAVKVCIALVLVNLVNAQALKGRDTEDNPELAVGGGSFSNEKY